MKFSELNTLHNILRINPNTGSLSNKNKIALPRFLTEAKAEIEIYETAQKSLFAKYKLEPGKTGDYSESNLKLKDDDFTTWQKCENEWIDLGKQESNIKPLILEESEFFALVKEKTLNRIDKDGKGYKYDFVYNMDELELLSRLLLKPVTKK